jgi:hypothetical protein
MEQSELDLKRATLERIYSEACREDIQSSPLLVILTKIWQHFSPLFKKRKKVIVRQQCDRFGTVFWTVYDPMTGYSQAFSSTAQLLAWLQDYSS